MVKYTRLLKTSSRSLEPCATKVLLSLSYSITQSILPASCKSSASMIRWSDDSQRLLQGQASYASWRANMTSFKLGEKSSWRLWFLVVYSWLLNVTLTTTKTYIRTLCLHTKFYNCIRFKSSLSIVTNRSLILRRLISKTQWTLSSQSLVFQSSFDRINQLSSSTVDEPWRSHALDLSKK